MPPSIPDVLAPLLQTLRSLRDRPHAPFYVPGHKCGHGVHPELAELLGEHVFRVDLPELPDLDNLFAPEGVIREAQELAAQTFGADRTWFLANGSTSGIEAMVLATCRPGDKLILPRNCHQSAIAALILSGVVPIFVTPELDPHWGIAHGVPPQRIAEALQQHPDAKAVMLVSPTYYGVCSDVKAIAHLTHQHNIPLLVDEAHGAHFAFHPDLPTPALTAGADVVVQSTHKTLGALTQSAMLHAQGDRVSPNRIQKALALVQSTSPSYLLLASLDAARLQMAESGFVLMERTLALAQMARDRLSSIPGLKVLDLPDLQLQDVVDSVFFDRTRLTVDIRELGLTGFEADEILHEEYKVTCELPGLHSLTFVLTLGTTETDIQQLINAFKTLLNQHHPSPSLSPFSPTPTPPHSPLALTPRDAFFADTNLIPVEQAPGHIAADLICPYPPGIPVLVPGEIVTEEAIAYLQGIQSAGGILTGSTDPTLEKFRVIQ
ncbi:MULTISPECIES: aminotransferase class I/II-fold pyridoxal phosphate-dependent enzyme [unclassified Leptolyngbya]|uniref:aminotransferase class I/II-fold pyridoxal phosphate-dependent enzyme n=1 Tax=unclassified Leptolyngbya TaxID=2650499 RepID=UPI001681E20A|nr:MULTISPECIES: aminotransferase class I/II-fold pyridoxal phosphate-dependent enzyme [unclassified Leptolyngbya]MBD1911430.1 aminotransferase class I/II-fold pyridoxal phosphate-dependent enzyme [Leptolyngbya sp. FACHB-8]MBD2153442.1 aminotransferase class I/II-fold pyridoxal phosphate-dependent enzyme [Leptolyngbya sp. FACHB-16]